MKKLLSAIVILTTGLTVCQAQDQMADTTIRITVHATMINPSSADTLLLTKTDTLLPEIARPSADTLQQAEIDVPLVEKTNKVLITNLLPTPVIRKESFILSGRIVDAETGETAPYATIRVEKMGLGTVSNVDGNWTLKLSAAAANESITFKYLGYINQTINISRLPDYSVIRLKPSNYELKEIVVTPDKQFEVLRKAWNAIPTNYPVEPTLTQGFYRETQRVNDSMFLYFNEAVLNVYKNTYRNNHNFGQIEVEKSRKNVFPGIDSINDVRFYGGPHFPNDLDIVFSRWDFIKPSEFRNWKYELEGMYMDSLSNTYTISFKNKLKPFSNFQGRIYIDADTYAYIGFELKRFGVGSISSEDIPTNVSYISGTTTIKIGYTEKDDRFFLSHINYKTNGINTASKTRIYKDIEYITTAIRTDSVTAIPFDRQFDYTDILSIEADNYDQTYWKDYNVLQESQFQTNQTQLLYGKEKAIEQLTKVYNTELTEQEKTLLFLKRFTFEGGISYHPLNFTGGEYLIGYAADPLDPLNPQAGKILKSSLFGISTTDGLRFELTKQLSLFGTLSTALYGMDQIQSALGLNYRLCLLPSGRWFFLDLGLGAGLSISKMPLGEIDISGGSLRVNGKTLKSDKLQVNAGQNGFGIKGVIGLAVRMGKQYELFADWNYLLPLIKSNYVQFKETEGFFLSRKQAKVDWDDTDDLYFWVDENNQSNYTRVTSSRFDVEPYYFRIGIRSGF